MAIIIEMPKLSDTMTAGTLVKWLKNEGDKAEPGDMLAEVETDKATMEVENFDEGVLLKQYVQPGQEVKIGAPICAIGDEGEEIPEAEAPQEKEDEGEEKKDKDEAKTPSKKKEESAESRKPEAKEEEQEERPRTKEDQATFVTKAPSPDFQGDQDARTGSGSDRREGERIKASPLARKIANERGLDLSLIRGTGPGGRIVRDDVETAAQTQPAGSTQRTRSKDSTTGSATSAPMPMGTPEAKQIPVSNMRKAIARRLVESKTTIPHFYLEIEVDAGPLSDLRASLNETLAALPPEQGGIKLTVNDLILRASAIALVRVPAVNRSWGDEQIQQHGGVHLAFGVAVEEGLLTPVIRDAHTKGLRQLSLEARELVQKARAKKLKPEEMSDSTFTVTNLGMFGIESFYGIINPPNAAILSVGATFRKPVADSQDNIVVGRRMKVGLSGDHRVVDGASGAEFLGALKEILEKPALMLV